MGIHGLMKLLSEEAPGCVKEQEVRMRMSTSSFLPGLIRFLFRSVSWTITLAEKSPSMLPWPCTNF
jgi:hypothetical protein